MDAANRILICNAGSSSLKTEVFEWARQESQCRPLLRAVLEHIGRPESYLRVGGSEPEPVGPVHDHDQAADILMSRLLEHLGAPRIVAAGHRIVHGGDAFRAPVRITSDVREQLKALGRLAPLHNPPALAVLEAVERVLPGVPMIAAFDTAFFHRLPPHVRRYAIPDGWWTEHRIQRYGFHGIAHEYLHRRLIELWGGDDSPQRVVTLQLGHGCSAAALLGGAPVETSMGFTPLEGLIMATRSGDLDPGVLLHMAQQGESWQSMEQALNHRSGLLGLSGTSGDMRELVRLQAHGHPGAALAIETFCHRVYKYVGAYAAALGGIDAVVFGGGIGENAVEVRARICKGLRWLGLELDEGANAGAVGREGRISGPGTVAAFVVNVREEQVIAEAVVECLAPMKQGTAREREVEG